jgi:hypothetical protein
VVINDSLPKIIKDYLEAPGIPVQNMISKSAWSKKEPVIAAHPTA